MTLLFFGGFLKDLLIINDYFDTYEVGQSEAPGQFEYSSNAVWSVVNSRPVNVILLARTLAAIRTLELCGSLAADDTPKHLAKGINREVFETGEIKAFLQCLE